MMAKEISIHAQNVSECAFMVSLKQRVKGSMRQCGGSILTTTLTLTAAHCLIFGIKDLILTFGSVHLFKGGIQHNATSILTHQDFNVDTMAYDIGLVNIHPATLVYNHNIQPVPLPGKSVMFANNDFVTIYGWGAVSDQQLFSTILRHVTLPYVPKVICQKLLKSWIPDHTFCLGYPDGHLDACLGDSGGPAMLEGVQVGITSFGEGCAVPLKPGVYTDLSMHLDWLKQLRINTLTQL